MYSGVLADDRFSVILHIIGKETEVSGLYDEVMKFRCPFTLPWPIYLTDEELPTVEYDVVYHKLEAHVKGEKFVRLSLYFDSKFSYRDTVKDMSSEYPNVVFISIWKENHLPDYHLREGQALCLNGVLETNMETKGRNMGEQEITSFSLHLLKNLWMAGLMEGEE